MTIDMVLGQLSYNILAEEYPKAATHVKQLDKNHWSLQLDVCSYIGVGRFVLGLFDDIEVKGDEGFKEYLKKKLTVFNGMA